MPEHSEVVRPSHSHSGWGQGTQWTPNQTAYQLRSQPMNGPWCLLSRSGSYFLLTSFFKLKLPMSMSAPQITAPGPESKGIQGQERWPLCLAGLTTSLQVDNLSWFPWRDRSSRPLSLWPEPFTLHSSVALHSLSNQRRPCPRRIANTFFQGLFSYKWQQVVSENTEMEESLCHPDSQSLSVPEGKGLVPLSTWAFHHQPTLVSWPHRMRVHGWAWWWQRPSRC